MNDTPKTQVTKTFSTCADVFYAFKRSAFAFEFDVCFFQKHGATFSG